MYRQFTIVQRHVFNVEIEGYTGAEATVLEQMLYEGDAPLSALKSHGYAANCLDCGVEVMDEQVCRSCGCTDDEACSSEVESTCHWAEDDLCSFCVGKESLPDAPLPFDITSPSDGAQTTTPCQK